MSIHVVGISGSLRRASFNTAALRAAQMLVPEGMTLELLDLVPIPIFNKDVEDVGMPEAVQHFHRHLIRADALLISTPEYNFSIPGGLKNAIDWATRSPGKSSLMGKPAAIMGVTTGQWGTLRAQLHLREILYHERMPLVMQPEVLIANAKQKFDAEGQLTDEATREAIGQLLVGLRDLTLRVQAMTAGAS